MGEDEFANEMVKMYHLVRKFKEDTGIDFVVIGFSKDKVEGLKKGDLSSPCLGVTSTMSDEEVDKLLLMLAHARTVNEDE